MTLYVVDYQTKAKELREARVTNDQLKEDQTKLQQQVTRLTGECTVQLYANMQTVQDWLSVQAHKDSTANTS